MDKETQQEIIRLFSKPLYRPFKDIDKTLGLPEGTSRAFLVKERLFKLESFSLTQHKKPK